MRLRLEHRQDRVHKVNLRLRLEYLLVKRIKAQMLLQLVRQLGNLVKEQTLLRLVILPDSARNNYMRLPSAKLQVIILKEHLLLPLGTKPVTLSNKRVQFQLEIRHQLHINRHKDYTLFPSGIKRGSIIRTSMHLLLDIKPALGHKELGLLRLEFTRGRLAKVHMQLRLEFTLLRAHKAHTLLPSDTTPVI